MTTKALIVAGAVAATLSSAAAQAPQAQPVDIIIQKGFAELIEIPGAIDQLIIGDPLVIDVIPVTSNTFLMNGLALGTTNVIVVDEQARPLFRGRVHVRPVRIWPGYEVNVVHGTSLHHGYSCDREAGCQATKFQPVAAPQPTNIFLGDNVNVNTASAMGAGVGVGQAPAPAAE